MQVADHDASGAFNEPLMDNQAEGLEEYFLSSMDMELSSIDMELSSMDMELSQSSNYPSPPPYERTYSEASSPGPLASTPTKEPLHDDSTAHKTDSMSISDLSLVSSIAESENPVSESRDESSTTSKPSIPGYKNVFNNIDKTVRPRQMRIDSQNKSLHYVHIYSVKNRIDFSSLSDTPLANVRDIT